MTEPLDIPVYGRSWARLESFSRLAGPLRGAPNDGTYRVKYRNMRAIDGRGRHFGSLMIAVLNICFEIFFFLWLMQPDHFASTNPGPVEQAARVRRPMRTRRRRRRRPSGPPSGI